MESRFRISLKDGNSDSPVAQSAEQRTVNRVSEVRALPGELNTKPSESLIKRLPDQKSERDFPNLEFR